MQGMKPQKPYQSPEISNEGNNSINNRKHARGGRRFKWSSSILAALPFKLRQNCWEADEKKEGRSLVWSEKHQFPWRLARKKYIYIISLYSMRRFPRHCHSLVDASCKRHHTPYDIQLGKKKKIYLKSCRVKHHGTYILLRARHQQHRRKRRYSQWTFLLMLYEEGKGMPTRDWHWVHRSLRPGSCHGVSARLLQLLLLSSSSSLSWGKNGCSHID